MGVSQEIAAGAVICGAYFGDKMTPLSETTILEPQLVGRGLTQNRILDPDLHPWYVGGAQWSSPLKHTWSEHVEAGRPDRTTTARTA
jgi:hypothetical protein